MLQTFLLPCCLLLSADEAKKPALAGTWKVVRAEVDGKDVLDGSPLEFRAVFTAETIKIEAGTPDPKQEPQFTYKTDSSTSPKIIDLAGAGPQKGMTFEGIYEVSGGELKVCFRAAAGVKERPTEFTSKDGMVLLVLKRQ